MSASCVCLSHAASGSAVATVALDMLCPTILGPDRAVNEHSERSFCHPPLQPHAPFSAFAIAPTLLAATALALSAAAARCGIQYEPLRLAMCTTCTELPLDSNCHVTLHQNHHHRCPSNMPPASLAYRTPPSPLLQHNLCRLRSLCPLCRVWPRCRLWPDPLRRQPLRPALPLLRSPPSQCSHPARPSTSWGPAAA